MTKIITITCSDEQAELFSDQFILDRIEAGASRHTLMVRHWVDRYGECREIRHSRLGVKIKIENPVREIEEMSAP